ncbi:uncharacterized protein LOC131605332 [Vicia villosa]|uniref:uncharacterized protein LOC131605329 n=1 Tax=Vicia villosa TaxID=3911 RepID=UPI00273C4536|nr:uncharacterized protein LOC131605329 [Vicia villosa]XP_058733687.1 uncharacterized protein LOC131605332 [Vicia villosa]
MANRLGNVSGLSMFSEEKLREMSGAKLLDEIMLKSCVGVLVIDMVILLMHGKKNMQHMILNLLIKLRTSGLPNHRIKLKVGTPIMLMRNLDQSDGLCNGTRLIVTRLASHVSEAKIISGKNIGNLFYIPRMSMSPSESPWPFKLIRRQFPIIVSYAMTINKSQGQSLDSVGLYLPSPVFSHGQFYVAISRVTTKSGLKILIHDKENVPCSITTNVVYKEVFQSLC